MSDLVLTDHPALDALERDIATAILAADDEAGLDQVRVSALGKKGSVSELLKSLGAMSPDERKVMGPAINGLRDRVQTLLAVRKEALKTAALEARLATETVDITLPVRESPAEIGRDECHVLRAHRKFARFTAVPRMKHHLPALIRDRDFPAIR